MALNEKAYKIRRRFDGLFSTGGMSPSFNKIGKVWKKLGHFKSHLAQIRPYRDSGIGQNFGKEYKDCEVVEYEMVETTAYPVIDILEERKTAWKQEQEERDKRHAIWRKKNLEEELVKINKELKIL